MKGGNKGFSMVKGIEPTIEITEIATETEETVIHSHFQSKNQNHHPHPLKSTLIRPKNFLA
jgi:hypothetical protein